MNDMVKNMVDMLFQACEETEEVRAMRDEVMENCQERFVDLVAEGMSEEAAVAAVVESLSGMEEVIADLPKKQAQTKADAEENESTASFGEMFFDVDEWVFPAEDVGRIQVQTVSDDVFFTASQDGMVHVRADLPEDRKGSARECLEVQCGDGTLRIGQRTMKKDASGAENDFELNADDLGELFRGIGRIFRKSMQQVITNLGDCHVTVSLPEQLLVSADIRTTSGDVNVNVISLPELRVSTTSGDIHVVSAGVTEQGELVNEQMNLATTSGDVYVNAAMSGNLSVTTISGDVRTDVACGGGFVLHTTSGDANVDFCAKEAQLETVSGDIDGRVLDARIQTLMLRSVSGDMDICLPENLALQMTGSGRGIVNHRCSNVVGSVDIAMRTVSGDVNIR